MELNVNQFDALFPKLFLFEKTYKLFSALFSSHLHHPNDLSRLQFDLFEMF